MLDHFAGLRAEPGTGQPAFGTLLRLLDTGRVWDSDWPHVNMNDRSMPNDGDLVDLLARRVPDETARNRILVDNPAALFGF